MPRIQGGEEDSISFATLEHCSRCDSDTTHTSKRRMLIYHGSQKMDEFKDQESRNAHQGRGLQAEAAAKPLDRTTSGATTLSKKRANLFMISIVLTQMVQMFAYGAGVSGALTIGRSLGISDLEATWIAASYPLTQGAFVLISGRLGSVIGHKRVMTIGAGWWVFWTLATAYSPTLIGISFFRALSGIGGGLMVPNAVALLTVTFPPGKQRNLALALFSAMGPVGGAGGCTVVGLFMQWTEWKWLFFFLAALGLVVFGAAVLSVAEDEPLDPEGMIDWIGSYFGVAGLILFNFVWNQAPLVGWDSPYEYVLLVVAIGHFVMFVIWEARYAANPVIPSDIWKTPSFTAITLVLFLIFMSLGIYIWYVVLFLVNIRRWSPVLVGLSWLPTAISGVLSAFLAAWAISKMSAQIIVSAGCVAAAGMNILLATTPVHQSFWAMIFPAMILAAFSGDMVFAAGQIIASNIVSKKSQGAAGSLIGTLFTYGLSTGLGFAGTVEAYVNPNGTDLLAGYRGAVYLAIGFAGAALAVNTLFVRMKKNMAEGWQGGDVV